jgi:hypothetical protein
MTPREWIEEMLKENREALLQMPFPPGLEELVQELVSSGQTERIVSMMKLGFLMGIQQGVRSDQGQVPQPSRIQA